MISVIVIIHNRLNENADISTSFLLFDRKNKPCTQSIAALQKPNLQPAWLHADRTTTTVKN